MPPKTKTMGQRSLAQQLEGWNLNPEGFVEIVEQLQAAKTAAEASVGYQYHAQSTIDRRETHLKEYESVMAARAKMDKVEVTDAYLWGKVSRNISRRPILTHS